MINILGYKLKEARETAGISISDLAVQSTLSNKQIEQIENGGDSTFYSESIKLTATKKVANLLGLQEDDYLKKIQVIKT